MPDRYGDAGDDFGPAYRQRRQDAIDECGLCEPDGLTPQGFACDHVDHAAAARRGMDMVREAMGWDE